MNVFQSSNLYFCFHMLRDEAAAFHLADVESGIAKERTELQVELKKWKTEMVEEKKEKEQTLNEMKSQVDNAKGG